MKKKQAPEQGMQTAVDILYDMVNEAHRKNYISYKITEVPDIPDLSMLMGEVAEELFRRVVEYAKDHPQVSASNTTPALCFYTGIGAVKLWEIDAPRLIARGVVREIVSPRGLEKMDEYVMDLVGIGYGSAKFEELMHQLSDMESFGISLISKSEKEEEAYLQFLEFMKAMYLYGMVYEMDRLGMKGAPQ